MIINTVMLKHNISYSALYPRQQPWLKVIIHSLWFDNPLLITLFAKLKAYFKQKPHGLVYMYVCIVCKYCARVEFLKAYVDRNVHIHVICDNASLFTIIHSEL